MKNTPAAVMCLCALAAGASAPAAEPALVRIATFNASLNRSAEGQLLRDLMSPGNVQAGKVAEIIQRVRPDILLLQEFDYDAAGAALAAFESNYLGRPQNGQAPIHFEYRYFTASNTGVPSGFDLDNDGRISGGGDALGFGEFPGQYAMVLLSRFPIEHRQARTFGKFLWRDMPGALLPEGWYTSEELAVLPLSSKNHWDVPVKIGRHRLHLLISHPTPPAFDGPEDRNGRRNHDEIRFWTDYLTPAEAGYILDDRGQRGGLRGKRFVIMGDLNSDPVDGDSLQAAIKDLIQHPRVASVPVPVNPGAPEAADLQGGANAVQRGDARLDTADFSDRVVGNLRVDYLLPSKAGLAVCAAGAFWPASSAPEAALVWGTPPPSSDHRLLWMDVTVNADRCPPRSGPTTNEFWRRLH